MPYFPFYPADWANSSNLRRCSSSARGDWVDILCVLHDSDEYGIVRWPLKELARTAKVPMKSIKELVEKGVLKGSDSSCEEYVFTPKHAGKFGTPVTLVEKSEGPCWYSSRFVRDHYVRKKKGSSTQFSEENQPPSRSPKGGIGEEFGERQKKSLPSPNHSPNSSPHPSPSRSPKGGLVNGLSNSNSNYRINNPPPTSTHENLPPGKPEGSEDGFLKSGSGDGSVLAPFSSFFDQFDEIDPNDWEGCVLLMATKVAQIEQEAGRLEKTVAAYVNGIAKKWIHAKVAKTEELRQAILKWEEPKRKAWEAAQVKAFEDATVKKETARRLKMLAEFERLPRVHDRIFEEAAKRMPDPWKTEKYCQMENKIFRSHVIDVFEEECASGVI